MSPTAAGLAAALHLLTALALWWVSPLKQIDIPDAPIEVTMEEPPKPEPPPQPQPEPPKPPGAMTAPAPPPSTAPTGRMGLPPTRTARRAFAQRTDHRTAPAGRGAAGGAAQGSANRGPPTGA